MTLNQKITLSFLSLAMTSISLQAGVVRGIVFDKTTKEALIGATVRVKSIQTGTLTDTDGHFSLNLKEGNHSIAVSCIGYADTTVVAYTGVHEDDIFLDIPLEPDATTLSEVTVTATARKDTEAAMMEEDEQNAT